MPSRDASSEALSHGQRPWREISDCLYEDRGCALDACRSSGPHYFSESSLVSEMSNSVAEFPRLKRGVQFIGSGALAARRMLNWFLQESARVRSVVTFQF
jgi:hypothetical protein